ncbi:MAG: hypothetical protein AB1734_10735 [Elusimicrobiota bacterium]
MANINGGGGNRLIIIAAIISLTLLALAGIKFMMSGGEESSAPAAAQREDIFSSSGEDAPPPELNPLARSENPGGGSLDMFSETNAGYYGEDEEKAEVPDASPAPAAKVAGPTAPAAGKTAAKPKAGTNSTVVPRMKMVPFKSITPTNVAPSNAAGRQGMPDLSTIMKQAQEQSGRSGSGD